MNPITEKQKAVLQFIIDFKKREEMSPTMREICDNFGFTPRTAMDYVIAIEKKGYIKRGDGGKSRSIRILKTPEPPK